MDFGKLAYNRLDTVDFSLPPDPEGNRRVLSGKRVAAPQVYLGCPRWSVKEWIGRLYPKGTKDAQFLEEYIRQFSCIELNATFYNLFDEAAVQRWAEKAEGAQFQFCPKVFQGISHEGPLPEAVPLMHAFEKSVSAFGEHLGPAFLQLNDGFGPQRKKELEYFINALPTAFNLFVEVRHPNWFDVAELEWLADTLGAVNKGLMITDVAGRRDVCHMRLSVPRGFVRFQAHNGHHTVYERLDAWAERVAQWLEGGLEELHFIVHVHDEKFAPEIVRYAAERFNAVCGLELHVPKLDVERALAKPKTLRHKEPPKEQGSLFGEE